MFSLVIPVLDEEATLRELARRLTPVLDELGDCEVLLVDDGSRDGTYALMLELNAFDPRFKALRLSRNFGHQMAITAGLNAASGDAVIVMDADLQHPPEAVPAFVAHWREGYEVVYGVMVRRDSETRFKKLSARLFYKLMRRMTRVEMPDAAGDFRLLDRKAVDAFTSLRETNRYVRGLIAWIGFRQIGVPYECPPRYAGSSKYSTRRMFKLAADGIFSFSVLPLRLVLKLGLLTSVLAFLVGAFAVFAKVSGAFTVPGWASLLVVTSFFAGVQLTVIGAMGEYIGRIYDEVKQRPLYVVSDAAGFDAADAPRLTATVTAGNAPRDL